MIDPVLHKGWTEAHLREVLPRAPEPVRDVLRFIATHPGAISPEIADGLGLPGPASVGQILRQLNRLGDEAGIRDVDGEFHWPLELERKRAGHGVYDMRPPVRKIVLEVLATGGARSRKPSVGSTDFEGAGWPEVIHWASRLIVHPDFDHTERTYKIKTGEVVAQAREALLANDPEWVVRFRRAFTIDLNNLTSFRSHQAVYDWAREDPERAGEALRVLWEPGDDSGLARFFELLPLEVVRGTGTRVSIASFLLLGVGSTTYPFFKPTVYSDMRRLIGIQRPAQVGVRPGSEIRPEILAAKLGMDGVRVRDFLRRTYPRTPDEAGDPWLLSDEQVDAVLAEFAGTAEPQNEVGTYAEWTELLAELRQRLLDDGSQVRDALDAQGLAWWLTRLDAPDDWDPEDRLAFAKFQRRATPVPDPPMDPARVHLPPVSAAMAEKVHLPESWLGEFLSLLDEKRQAILYGPPGTGKTFVAQHIGRHVEQHGGTYRLIQFHPSYTYEDFFEGYRPEAREDGTLAFRLVPGALRQLASAAEEHPDVPHVLIIDEINRGNIAKIFGELYFLLEYRDQAIRLQYSAETKFRLPDNLFVIGTMNTADRSIALVDGALRRRFYFEGLTPTQYPVDGVLASWLDRHGLDPEPALVLDELNRMIGDPDFAVGPSYFIGRDGTAPDLHRIWKHAVIPLLEEQYYGSGRDVSKDFALNAILQRIQTSEGRSEQEDAG